MTLALTPNVKRVCLQLSMARRIQGQSLAVAADTALLSIKGLNSLYAGRGSPQLASLNALAIMHGLGPITTVVRPERVDAHQTEGVSNVMHLLHALNAEQALRGKMRQRAIRSESRFLFASLGLGHRILTDRDVYEASSSAMVSAVAVDVKAMVLKQGGICLRTPILKYDGGELNLNDAVPLPVFDGALGAAQKTHQGRGQDNAEPNDVPTGDTDDVDDSAEQALWDELMNSKGA